MEDIFYEITYKDGTTLHSSETSWHKHSHKILVQVGNTGRVKQVYASHEQVSSLLVHFKDLERRVDVPEDCSVYQAITAEKTFSTAGYESDVILGVTIGLVKDGIIIEEYFLDGRQAQVFGFKY